MLSLEFCASPEFEETRRLTHELAGAGRAPFTVESGSERIAMPTLSAAVRHVMASARKGLEIQRYKGLGEMNPEQLWDTTMNPETRTLLEVRVDDMPEAERIFSELSAGGQIFMPMQETFFATRFGQLRDPFGINWMILHERPMPARQ